MYPKWLWPVFAIPGVVWLMLLFLVPFYAVIGVAFGGVDPIFQSPVPAWNPLQWNFDSALNTLQGFLPGREIIKNSQNKKYIQRFDKSQIIIRKNKQS